MPGFIAFNRIYVERLARLGHLQDDVNPVARSNVCPEIDPPAEPSFYAFSYTVPGDGGGPSFVVAGSGEAREGGGSYAERIVRLGDQSPDGMRDKARFVLGEMERRMAALGFGWADVTATQVYTVFDIHPFLADEFVRRGAAPRRPDLALRPPAGAGPRLRGRCPRRRQRTGDLGPSPPLCCVEVRRLFGPMAGGGLLPVLALEQAAGLHRRGVVIVEAAGVDAVILRIGARLVEGVDAAMPAEGVLCRAGAEGVGRQVVGAAQHLQALAWHRQVQDALLGADRAVALADHAFIRSASMRNRTRPQWQPPS